MPRRPNTSAAILRLLRGSARHAWTLDDLREGLRASDCTADFSTVFRAAEKLAGAGALVKVSLDDGRTRFELAAAHHDHLHCTSCDALVPVPCVIDGVDCAALEAATGVAVRTHSVVLSGLCPECRATPGDVR